MIQLALSALLLLSCTHHHHSKDGLHQHTGKHAPGHINDMYLDPKLNAQEKNDDFESWDRDVNTFRSEIVDALPIKTGDAIADVGAGTGIFESLLSHKTGPGGKVYAIDIAPSFIPFMKNRFEQEKLKNVEVILGKLDTTSLKDTSVNLVVVIDTYHHFDDAIVMLKDFQRILRPGGHLVIVDFKKTQTAREWIKNHISKTKEDYVKEITAEHFEFIREENIPFKESFQLTFRKKTK